MRHIRSFTEFEACETQLRMHGKAGMGVHFFLDEHFPARLKHAPDHPLVLYTKGEPIYRMKKVIGVVGTRKMTPYGRSFLKEFLADLAKVDLCVLSGLHKTC
jgi:DNA processing protein